MDEIDAAFARTLRALRTQRNLPQEAFALDAGLHRTYVSQLERGLKTPSLKTIYKITQVLGISLQEFAALVERELEHVQAD